MKRIYTVLLLIISHGLHSQTSQGAIDADIWIPFTKAWESNDATAFNQLHTSDVLRVNAGGILIGKQYLNQNVEYMIPAENPSERIIEFAFDMRLVNGDLAYETGFYRISQSKGMKPYVARFHVLLKRDNGQWKIALDYDAPKVGDVAVPESAYQNLTFIHFVKKE